MCRQAITFTLEGNNTNLDKIKIGAQEVQSNDIQALKNVITTYMIASMDPKEVSPSLSCSDKEARGFHHSQMVRLLFPIKYLLDFDDDENK